MLEYMYLLIVSASFSKLYKFSDCIYNVLLQQYHHVRFEYYIPNVLKADFVQVLEVGSTLVI